MIRSRIVFFAAVAFAAFASAGEPAVFRRVTLEMSLKPFFSVDEPAIDVVCRTVFRQWEPLIRRADSTAILLWTADGSEILDYRGRAADEIEWARYIGIGHPPPKPSTGEAAKSLHATPHLYREKPAKITYADLARIVAALKCVGREMTGKPVLVGATFDPGPEFARSPFKYERHPEIAQGETMGTGRWVSCAAVLKGDTIAYAGFPKGIPDGTSFGTFLGRQSRHFLGDLGFDYLWLSNGFGFSLSSWSVKGLIFDGKEFHGEKADTVREEILRFWRDFHAECPQFPIETRGSNLTVGADLGSGGSPIGEIYSGGFRMTAPPNSPWAALDGDFGLELVGYLSRIAELPPDEVFPFRYYTHDPWWLNSPWFDRYGREPHDIYLPLALARLDRRGQVTRPAYMAFLTIDNSFGEMPDECPLGVIPHILAAMRHYSDEPGLVTWIYPFREYHRMAFGDPSRLAEPFFGDWFVRAAVNRGLPLNTVVSTDNFIASRKTKPDLFRRTVLMAPVPDAGSPLDAELREAIRSGHDVFFYGPTARASKELLDLLNLRTVEPISGELAIKAGEALDRLADGKFSSRLNHREVLSAGGIDTAVKDEKLAGFQCVAQVGEPKNRRAYAVFRDRPLGPNSGRVAWVRGSFNGTIGGGHLPTPDDPAKLFTTDVLLRWMLAHFGVRVEVEKPSVKTRDPLVLAARSRNGLFFSGYSPSTAATVRLRLPHGAPILVGAETVLQDGCSVYQMPRAWHRECRCLIEQSAGEVSCVERYSGHIGIARRLHLKGLQNATVHFLPETIDGRVIFAANNLAPFNEKSLPFDREDNGRRLVVRNVTGELLISW